MKTGVIFGILAASMSVPALAEGVRDHEIAELRSMVDTLRTEVDVLRAHDSDQWLNEARTEQIRGIVQDVLADADTRATLQGDGATSGYKDGFFIQSADGNWSMKINGQIQARFMYNNMPDPTGPESVDYGFEMRRLKLKFSGTIIDPSWGYKISIINQRNAQGLNNNTAGMYVEDAWIKKTFDNGMYARVGQFKAPFLREELVSSSAQLAVERSLINNQWTYGWTQGIELGSKSDRLWWRAMYLDGPHTANSQSIGPGDATSIVARADYRIAGEWSDWKSLTGHGDHSEFYAFVGGALQWFNMSNQAPPAPPASAEYGGMIDTRSYGFTVDGSMGGESWTAYASFVWSDNEGGGQGNSAWGALVQGGYFIQEDVELYGRWEYSTIGRIAFAPADNTLSVMTLGINYWPVGVKNLKWTTDFGYAFTAIVGRGAGLGSASGDYNSSGNGWNADPNDGQWLVRTQLQLLF